MLTRQRLPLLLIALALTAALTTPARAQEPPEATSPEPPEAPEPPEPPEAPEPPAPAPSLTTRLYEAHHRAIVRVDTAGGVGAGFLFHSPRHVATAFHVIARGRPVRVVLIGGERIPARVVAVDEEDDLAILELDRAVQGVAPLTLWSGEPVPIGTRVIAIGHPYSPLSRQAERLGGLLDWAVAQGVVSHRTERLIQTDAALNPGNSGGPVIAEDGRVLGLVSFKIGQGEGLSFASSWKGLAELEGRLEDEEATAYRGRWALEASLDTWYQSAADVTDSTLLGTGFGIAAVGYDRWALTGRVALAGRSILVDDRSLIEEDTDRVILQADVGYRFLLMPSDELPIYVAPTVGAQLALDQTQTSRLSLELVDDGCAFEDGDRCETDAEVVRESEEEQRLWPVVGANTMLGPLVVSYALLPRGSNLFEHQQLIVSLQFEFLNF